MLKIAYLTNVYPTASTTFIRRELLALERRKASVMRIALRGWDEPLVDQEDFRERHRTKYALRNGYAAIPVAVLGALFRKPLAFAKATFLCCKMSRGSDRATYVHFIYLGEACRIARWLRVGNIRHLHVHFGTNAAEVAMLVQALGGPSWSFTVHGVETFFGFAEKVRSCAFVVAVSSYGRAQLYRRLERNLWNKVRLVRCGLDIAFYNRAAQAIPKRPRLICVGRMSAEKGHFLLLDAACRLMSEGLEFELIFAGDGPLRKEIEIAIDELGLRSYIRVTGWISTTQVRQELLASRALVVPSFAEGLPIVIMEAMALERPVISTCIAGIPELVTSGRHGWLVPAGDVESIADAMKQCITAVPAALSKMGKAAREQVIRYHDVDRGSGELLDLFRMVIEAGPPVC